MTNPVPAIPLPATFADVTLDWFQAALHEGGMAGSELASIVVEPMHASKGLIGDLATVQVTYRSGSEPGPDAFVIKLPAANPASRQIGDMLQAYARESSRSIAMSRRKQQTPDWQPVSMREPTKNRADGP